MCAELGGRTYSGKELLLKYRFVQTTANDSPDYSHTGVAAKVPKLFELMHYIGLSFQTDKFLTDVVEIAAMASLRDLKYRARLPVAKGDLLYGK